MKRHSSGRKAFDLAFSIRLTSMYVSAEWDPNRFRRLKEFWPYQVQGVIEEKFGSIDLLSKQLRNYRGMDYEGV